MEKTNRFKHGQLYMAIWIILCESIMFSVDGAHNQLLIIIFSFYFNKQRWQWHTICHKFYCIVFDVFWFDDPFDYTLRERIAMNITLIRSRTGIYDQVHFQIISNSRTFLKTAHWAGFSPHYLVKNRRFSCRKSLKSLLNSNAEISLTNSW